MLGMSFNMESYSTVGKVDGSFLGNSFGVMYKLIRYYDSFSPTTISEHSSLPESKKALEEAVNNFNESFHDTYEGTDRVDSMILAEDGMSAGSFLHGSMKIEKVGIEDTL
jgi:hypothetical protein